MHVFSSSVFSCGLACDGSLHGLLLEAKRIWERRLAAVVLSLGPPSLAHWGIKEGLNAFVTFSIETEMPVRREDRMEFQSSIGV